MSGRLKLVLFFVVIVIPGLLSALTGVLAFQRAETVEFCSSCHTMTPWVESMTGKESDTLSSEHFKHRWIQHDQCYTCHSNYGFLGPLQAKIKGVRHVIAYYIGDNSHIKLYDPFPNENCLQCHQEAKTFLEDPNHDPLEDILSGKDSCIDCHENMHEVEQPGDGAGADPAKGGDGADKAAAADDGDKASGEHPDAAPGGDADKAE